MRYSSKTLGLAAVMTFGSVTNAHSLFTNLFVNDANQGDGTCIRMPKDGSTSTDPIAGITSQEMACGRDGQNAVAYTCPAPQGAKLTFEWRLFPDASQPGSIDISHKGPCAVYVKPVEDMQKTAAAGPGWFKIWESGYDEKTKKWCTETLIDNKGLMSVQLPSGLPKGNYLVRPELLALHNADKGDPQFYTGCAQVFVDGPDGVLAVPDKNKASIPGHVQPGEKSVSFNIWEPKMALPYPIPGPEVFYPAAAGGSSQPTKLGGDATPPPPTAFKGAVPQTCLLKVANWCGEEVPDYADSKGCYASSEQCFKQLDACYKTAPPTGSGGCAAWERKCTDIQSSCGSGASGPPNKGVKLPSPDAALPGPIPAVAGVPAGQVAVLSPTGTSGSGSGSGSSGASTSAAPAAASGSGSGSGSSDASASVAPAATTTAVAEKEKETVAAAPAPTTLVPQPKAGSGSGSGSGNSSDDNGGRQKVSEDGRCGESAEGRTCAGSQFGQCCSRSGRCGSSRWHCGARGGSSAGCQPGYGVCRRAGEGKAAAADADAGRSGAGAGQVKHAFGFGATDGSDGQEGY